MFTLLRQENRKLMHHRVIQLFIPFIMIFQFIIAIYAAHYPQLLTPYDAFVNNDYGFIPLLFLAITIGSTYLTNERQNGTLRALLYRSYSRTQVLVSKWLTILGLMIGLSGFSTLMSLGLKLSFFRRLPNYGTIWHTWGLNMLSTGLTLLFLMSVVLLLGTLFTSSTPAILTGIIGYFIVTIFNQLCFYLYAKVKLVKVESAQHDQSRRANPNTTTTTINPTKSIHAGDWLYRLSTVILNACQLFFSNP
nr:ABC transporter permease subunit [Lactiplantibacillus plantarum]